MAGGASRPSSTEHLALEWAPRTPHPFTSICGLEARDTHPLHLEAPVVQTCCPAGLADGCLRGPPESAHLPCDLLREDRDGTGPLGP